MDYQIGKLYKILVPKDCESLTAISSVEAMSKHMISYKIYNEDTVMLLGVKDSKIGKYKIFQILNSDGKYGQILLRMDEIIPAT